MFNFVEISEKKISIGQNINFKTSIQIYTNFPITFVFWRKKSKVKPFWKPSFFFFWPEVLQIWDPKSISEAGPNESLQPKIGPKLTDLELEQKWPLFHVKCYQILEGPKKAGFWPKKSLFSIFLGIPKWAKTFFEEIPQKFFWLDTFIKKRLSTLTKYQLIYQHIYRSCFKVHC